MNAELKGPPTLFVQDEISETLSPTGNHPHQEANFTLGHQKPGSEGTAPMPEEVPRTSDTSTSKFERLEVYQQIGQKVIWSIQNGQEKIKLALDPPQLGNIYMEITKDKENIRTTIWADTPGAKGILESNQTQLHKLLRDDGFNLEKFDVFVQEGMGSFQERREKWINQEERFQGGFEEDEGSSSHPLEIATVQTNLSVRGSHYVDCFV
jgi:flagellar hook-length control protein FliK